MTDSKRSELGQRKPSHTPGMHTRSRSSSRAKEKSPWTKYVFTVNTFLFFLTSFQLVNLLTLTYTDSVLNYIAKRFVIPNTMASFIPSSYMIGSVLAVIPVSYFGSTCNRPRAISIGILIMIFGLGLCILPHFIMKEYNATNSTKTLLCKPSPVKTITHKNYSSLFPTANRNALFDSGLHKMKKHTFREVWKDFIKEYHSPDKFIKTSLSTPLDLPCNKNSSAYNPSVLLILGHLLIGIGSSPLWPLGVAYLDDHVLSNKMSVYLGLFIGTTLTGPVAGFLLGSVGSAIFVTSNYQHVKPNDPRWIGAWWLGYVIAAGLLTLLLIPFCFFPESLRKSDEKKAEILKFMLEKEQKLVKARLMEYDGCLASDDDGACSSTYSETSTLIEERQIPISRIKRGLQELYKATVDILSRPVAIGCILAYAALSNLLSGVTTFGSTYIQKQFNVIRITSDMLIGGVCVPLAILSTFAGGYLIKRCNFNIRQSILFNVLMSTIGVLCFTCLYPIGCNLPPTAGIRKSNLSFLPTAEPNLICTKGCHCEKGQLKLICGDDNMTYISPCYAGCTHEDNITLATSKITHHYSSCKCIHTKYKVARLGACAIPFCTEHLIMFMVVCAFGISALCFCQAPAYSVLLRVLADANKPYGIGIMTVLSRLLGYIPAPIWFGYIIDMSCIYWGKKCNGKALCKLYDNTVLRSFFVTACVMCGSLYTITFALTYCWIKFRKDRNIEN